MNRPKVVPGRLGWGKQRSVFRIPMIAGEPVCLLLTMDGVNIDPVIDELATKLRQTPDHAEQQALTKKLVEREHDQVLRMWMPYDAGFFIWQPHARNIGQLALRSHGGYGASTLARLWLDK